MTILNVPSIYSDETFRTSFAAFVQEVFTQEEIMAIDEAPYIYGAPILRVHPSSLLKVIAFLKKHPDLRLDFLNDIHGIDMKTHIELVYVLQSHHLGKIVVVKTETSRPGGSVPSLTALYPTADWQEREVYDLLGVYFEDHPNLSRILLPDDWVGHPLLKDYEQYDEGI